MTKYNEYTISTYIFYIYKLHTIYIQHVYTQYKMQIDNAYSVCYMSYFCVLSSQLAMSSSKTTVTFLHCSLQLCSERVTDHDDS